MTRRSAAALICALLLGGCGAASGPAFKAGLHKPDSGRAMLYVYRQKTMVGIANWDPTLLHLDGRPLTRIRIGGHIAVPVSPGNHKLHTTWPAFGNDTTRVRGETTFAARAGSTVYIRYRESITSMTPIVTPHVAYVHSTSEARFEPVPEAQALAELANTTALELER